MKNSFCFHKIAAIVLLLIVANVTNAQTTVFNTVTGQVVNINNGNSSTILPPLSSPGVQIVVDNGWNNDYVGNIGQDGSTFYAQSFIATTSTITKFGVLIQEDGAEGQVILAIVAEDGSGKPNTAAPLYEGTLINPTTTAAWYFESDINIPVTIGQKYYVLIDGYNNAGATGISKIGTSNTQTNSGESFLYSNDPVGYWNEFGYYLAIYVEGGTAVVPVSYWPVIIAFALIGLLTLFGFRRKFAKAIH
ncbi:MAG TPA: hypothetical protein VJY41_11425 [Prolixibacteraceae bacterium]|nr:hypothetical protein [Prolixibacteraceae bacterium]